MPFQLKSKISRLKSAFTLIELLVVISIIAILIAVATVSYTNAQQKGRDNKRKSDLKAIQQALELYFQQNGKYPSGYADGIQCNTTDTSQHPWGTAFSCNSVTYMNPLPKDPTFSTADDKYFYDSPSPNSTYVLSAELENPKDSENKNNPLYSPPCGAAYANWRNRTTCVINP